MKKLYFTGVLLGLLSVACSPTPVETVDRSLIEGMDTASLRSVLDASRGEVVLVNLWATWCAPCLKEIPELVELEHQYAEQGFRLLGISLDDVEDRDRVLEFRDEWFPEFQTYHTTESDWFDLVTLIEPNWNSLLPTSFVLNREGELIETLTGSKDSATFAAAVEPLL